MRGYRYLYALGLSAAALAMTFAMTPAAHAAMIQLSTHATGSNNPADLDATLDFNVVGNTLLLTVTNDTVAPNDFRIREIFFNATSELTSLTPVSLPTGWSMLTNPTAGSFGKFDYSVSGGSGNTAPSIPAGGSLQFQFTFTGVGVTAMTFLSELSTHPNNPMLVAGRFIRQGSQGGYGGTNVIPAPGAALALIIAMVGMPRRRRHT